MLGLVQFAEISILSPISTREADVIKETLPYEREDWIVTIICNLSRYRCVLEGERPAIHAQN